MEGMMPTGIATRRAPLRRRARGFAAIGPEPAPLMPIALREVGDPGEPIMNVLRRVFEAGYRKGRADAAGGADDADGSALARR